MTELARTQFRLSLGLLIALGATFLGVCLLAEYSPVMSNYLAWQLQRQRQFNGTFLEGRGFVGAGNELLEGELFKTDYSRGGVYFIGASNMLVSLMPWELPAEERGLIHNYSLPALNHQEQRQFIQCLIDELNLLKAGGQKTTIFVSLDFRMGRGRFGQQFDDVVPVMFQRHGFFIYDSKAGIRVVPMWAVERFLRVQRIYANRFLRVLINPTDRVVIAKPQTDRGKEITHHMGPQWREHMEEQLRQLSALLDYLLDRGVHVEALFTPYPRWHDDYPFSGTYRQKVLPILQARNIPVRDLSHFLPEEDFLDETHSRYSGQRKLHEKYRELGLRALSDMGTSLPK